MSLKYQSVTGTKDILPEDVPLWQYMEETSRALFRIFNYQEIRTPIMENTELFMRSVGSDTDIVEKEMYTFIDRDEKSISLRPEETAGVIRAYLENGLYSLQSLWKLYYIGPMFRRERPQAGRFRQFHQIGAELIGSYSPGADCEMIIWLVDYFNRLKLKDIVLNLNSAGCPRCKPGYIIMLKEAAEQKLKLMCPDCQRRYKKNVFRILDCKQDQCRPVIDEFPVVSDYLCADCSKHFSELKRLLEMEGITYRLAPHLVRGIDYYTRTIFEFVHEGLGSQNAVAGGGRYDYLVQEMGGQSTGAVGFSIGEERLAMVIEKQESVPVAKDGINVYLISLDKESYDLNFKLLNELRKIDIISDIDYEERSIKAQMRNANRLNARYVILRGSEEIKEGVVTLKDMQNGTEEKVSNDKIIKVIVDCLKEGGVSG